MYDILAMTDLAQLDRQDLERALEALVQLVREEYPAHHSVAEIAEIWGQATPAQVEALRALPEPTRQGPPGCPCATG